MYEVSWWNSELSIRTCLLDVGDLMCAGPTTKHLPRAFASHDVGHRLDSCFAHAQGSCDNVFLSEGRVKMPANDVVDLALRPGGYRLSDLFAHTGRRDSSHVTRPATDRVIAADLHEVSVEQFDDQPGVALGPQ